MTNIETISSAAFCARLASGEALSVLDVRTALEHRGTHLDCHHDHMALDRLDVDDWLSEHPQVPGRPLYVLCASGRRATAAAQALAQRGVQAVVVEGGLNACVAQGLPTAGQKTISLERQVRIAAGAIVLINVMLGAFVHHLFLVLAGGVGAGLVFAGVTDRCGLALLLARAPWNDPDRAGKAARQSLNAFEHKEQGA